MVIIKNHTQWNRKSENDMYYFSGDDCENNANACTQSPCPLGRNCTDLTPQEEVALGRGYNCSDCPAGFADIDNKCEGTCVNRINKTASCDHLSGSLQETE